ncbi:MAG: T9SS type A sorting domain-containing protein [Mariniphaga sp.]|jgi:hypothetical protein|nr:T9SS type A sorting domain-containing protein [Mariniphaga sp.]
MKKIYSFPIVFAIVVLISAPSIYAQKSCTLKTGNGSFENYTVSEGFNVMQFDENTVITYKEHSTQSFEGKETHLMTVAPEGNWEMMIIADGGDFFEMAFGEPYEGEVPEGYYDIIIEGSNDNGDRCYLLYDQLHVISDTTFTPSTDEAVNLLSVEAYDMNGNEVSTLAPFKNFQATLEVNMAPSIGVTFLNRMSGFEDYYFIPTYFNDFGNRFNVSVDFSFMNIDSEFYAFLLPEINDGMNSNVTLSNSPEDFIRHKEVFNISDKYPEPSYGYIGFMTIMNREEGKNPGLTFNSGWNVLLTIDRDAPLEVITNVKLTEEPVPNTFDHLIVPFVYANYDTYNHGDFYIPKMSPFAMAIDDNGLIAKEQFGYFNSLWVKLHGNRTNILPFSPAAIRYNPENPIYYGYRTPMLYFQSRCFNEINSSTGDTYYRGSLVFMGEGGLQRYCDEDMFVSVKVNGTEVFNDSIFYFNGRKYITDPGIVEMAIENTNVYAYDMTMVNTSDITFDLSLEDAMPPTTTLLRVIDENGNESNNILDVANSRLEIAAGDFSYSFDNYTMVYVEKPEIEVSWSTDGSNFLPLEVVENEEMFYVSYGNFFEVSLAPLENVVSDGWVTVRINVTDASGNAITQTLTPLFHVGEIVGIAENLFTPIEHTVQPNPFIDNVTIHVSEPVNGNATFEIYDVTGRIVSQRIIDCHNKNTFTWNGNYVKAGMYFYNIYTTQGEIRGKFVKK